MISPVLADLAQHHAGSLKVVKVDVDANQAWHVVSERCPSLCWL
jgi:thioredoxin-like negative regulator of GroEL